MAPADLDAAELTRQITSAQSLAVRGDRASARAAYAEPWEHTAAAGDPYTACVASHFMAHAHDEHAAMPERTTRRLWLIRRTRDPAFAMPPSRRLPPPIVARLPQPYYTSGAEEHTPNLLCRIETIGAPSAPPRRVYFSLAASVSMVRRWEGSQMCISRRHPRFRMRLLLPLLSAVLLVTACSDDSSSSAARPTATSAPAATATATPVRPLPDGYLPGDWPRFGYDPARSGVNPNETGISPANVGRLHRLWQVTLPSTADSSPALLVALRLPDGSTRDVLYVTTLDGRLLALDAATGAQLWARHPAGVKITHSSPAIDPSRAYVYAYGLDGYVHKYAAATGDEARGGGWPVQITRFTTTEKESSSLNIANGYLYVTTSGYNGDAPPYQGHIVAIRLSDASTHVFNSLCSNLTRLLASNECSQEQSGIWARAGVVVDPTTGNLLVATGNGTFDANTGGHDWGDSVLELSPDASRLLDSYTPPVYQQLDDSDADLGSAAPALLPHLSGSSTPDLAVQGGKDGVLRLLNLRNLSGSGHPGAVGGEVQALPIPGCLVFTQPVVWPDPSGGAPWVFVAATCGLRAYQARTDGGGATRLAQVWSSDAVATTPVVAGGVLFAATGGAILALDPRTGSQLWSSADDTAGGGIGDIHWESLIVTGDRVYCPDEDNHLTAYGL